MTLAVDGSAMTAKNWIPSTEDSIRWTARWGGPPGGPSLRRGAPGAAGLTGAKSSRSAKICKPNVGEGPTCGPIPHRRGRP